MPWIVAYIPKNIPNAGGTVEPENNELAPSEDKLVKSEIYAKSDENEKVTVITNFTQTEAFKNQSKGIIPSSFFEYQGNVNKNIILEHNFNFFDSEFWDPDSENYTMRFYPFYNITAGYPYLYQEILESEFMQEHSKNTIGYNGSTGASFQREMGYLFDLLSRTNLTNTTTNGQKQIAQTLLDYKPNTDAETLFVSEDVYSDFTSG